MPEHIHTLLASLGGQPQVVTFTLDLLLRRGFPISEVIVMHPNPAVIRPDISQQRLKDSLGCLQKEFLTDHYKIDGRVINCHFRSRLLELNGVPLDDIKGDTDTKGTLDTVYHFIQELKQQPRHIHLSVTGGRRLMSLLAISAAQLKFDPFDHIWHIYTPDDLKPTVKDGAIMHVPPGAGVCLLEVPFIPLATYFSNLTQPFDSAQAARQSQMDQMDAKDRACCDFVVQQAKERWLDVLRPFAAGLRPQQVAEQLNLSIKTVDTYKTELLALCRIAWELPLKEHLDYHFFHTKFAGYFPDDE